MKRSLSSSSNEEWTTSRSDEEAQTEKSAAISAALYRIQTLANDPTVGADNDHYPFHRACDDLNKLQPDVATMEIAYQMLAEKHDFWLLLASHCIADALNDDSEITGFLVQHGLDANIYVDNGRTILTHAAAHSSISLVSALLDNGARVNTADRNGDYPIHCAAKHTGPDVLKLLLSKGADAHVQDSKGATPIAYATTEEKYQLLKDAGADINATDADGNTALHYLAKRGYGPSVAFMIKLGARVNIRNNHYETALHCVIGGCNFNKKNMYALLDAGVEIEAQNDENETALHLTAVESNDIATNALCQNNANVLAQDKNGNTPLHLAAMRG